MTNIYDVNLQHSAANSLSLSDPMTLKTPSGDCKTKTSLEKILLRWTHFWWYSHGLQTFIVQHLDKHLIHNATTKPFSGKTQDESNVQKKCHIAIKPAFTQILWNPKPKRTALLSSNFLSQLLMMALLLLWAAFCLNWTMALLISCIHQSQMTALLISCSFLSQLTAVQLQLWVSCTFTSQ